MQALLKWTNPLKTAFDWEMEIVSERGVSISETVSGRAAIVTQEVTKRDADQKQQKDASHVHDTQEALSPPQISVNPNSKSTEDQATVAHDPPRVNSPPPTSQIAVNQKPAMRECDSLEPKATRNPPPPQSSWKKIRKPKGPAPKDKHGKPRVWDSVYGGWSKSE